MRPSRRAASDVPSVLHIPPPERPSPSCFHCWRHLATDPAYIMCAHAACESRIICADCFRVGAADEVPHCLDHPYRVIEQVRTPLFEPDWTANDEMRLIDALCEFGPYHWKAIAERVGKSQEKCERHYECVYLTGENAPIPTSFLPLHSTSQPTATPVSSTPPDVGDHSLPVSQNTQTPLENTTEPVVTAIPTPPPATASPAALSSAAITPNGCTSSTPNSAPRSRQSDSDDEGDDSDSILADKVIPDPSYGNDTNIEGYMPRRSDLEIEYDDSAEDAIADIVVGDNDTEEERELKLQLLEIYDKRLTRRDQMKEFIFQRDLVHVDKVKVGDRRHTRDEKELLARLQVFSRLLPKKEFFAFRDAIMREFRQSREIYRLEQYRAAGIKRRAEIDVYELERRARANLLAKGKTVNWPSSLLSANPTLIQSPCASPEIDSNTKGKRTSSAKRRRTTKLSSPSVSPDTVAPLPNVARTLSNPPVARPNLLPPNMGFSAPLPQNLPIDASQFRTVQFSYGISQNGHDNTGVFLGDARASTAVPERYASGLPRVPAANILPNVTASRRDSSSAQTTRDAIWFAGETGALNVPVTSPNMHGLSSGQTCQLPVGHAEGGFYNASNNTVINHAKRAESAWDLSTIDYRANNPKPSNDIRPLQINIPADQPHLSPALISRENPVPTHQMGLNIEPIAVGSNVKGRGRLERGPNGVDMLNKNHDGRGRVPRSSSTLLRRERQHQRLLRSPYPQLRPMPLSGLADLWKLTIAEQKLCSVLHIKPNDFLRQRDAMLSQVKRYLQKNHGQLLDDKEGVLKLRCGPLLSTTYRTSNVPSEDGTENLSSGASPTNNLLHFNGKLTASTMQPGSGNVVFEDGLLANRDEEVESSRPSTSNDRRHATDRVETEAYKTGLKDASAPGVADEDRNVDVADVTMGGSGPEDTPTPPNSEKVVRRISVFVDATFPAEEDGNTYSNIDEVRMVTTRSVKFRRNIGTQCVPQDFDLAFPDVIPGNSVGLEPFTLENSNFYSLVPEQNFEEGSQHPSSKLVPLSSDDGHHSSERGSSSYVGRFLTELGASAKIMIEVDTRGAGPSGGSADSIGDRLCEAFGDVAYMVDCEESPALNGVENGYDDKETEDVDDHHTNSCEAGPMTSGRDVAELAIISQRQSGKSSKLQSACRDPLTTVNERINEGLTEVLEMGGERVVTTQITDGDGKSNTPSLLEAKVGIRILQVSNTEQETRLDVMHPRTAHVKGGKGEEDSRSGKSRKRPRPQQILHTGSDVKRKRRTKRIVLSEEEDDTRTVFAKDLVDEEILDEGRASVSDDPIKVPQRATKRRSGRPRGRGRGRVAVKRGRGKALEGASATKNLNDNVNVAVPEKSESPKLDESGNAGNGLEAKTEPPKLFLRLRLKSPDSPIHRRRRAQTQTRVLLEAGDDTEHDTEQIRGKHAPQSTVQQEVVCHEPPCILATPHSGMQNVGKKQDLSGRVLLPENVGSQSDGGHGKVDSEKRNFMKGKGVPGHKEQPVRKTRKGFTLNRVESGPFLLIPKESAPSKLYADPLLRRRVETNISGEGQDTTHQVNKCGSSGVLTEQEGENVGEITHSEPSTSAANHLRILPGRRFREDDEGGSDKNDANNNNNNQTFKGPPEGSNDIGIDRDVEPEQRLSKENVVWIEPSNAASEPRRPIRRTAGARGPGRRGRKPASSSGRGGRGRGSTNGRWDGSASASKGVATRSHGERYSLRRKL